MISEESKKMNAFELINEHFRTIQSDPAAWRQLFTEDAVLEMPYAPAHVPRTLNGIEAIAQSVGGFFKQFSDFKITVNNIDPIEGQDAAVAEFSVAAIVTHTGKPYHQEYILILRAKEGKIVFYREYFDGSRIIEAFTPVQN